MNKRTFLLCVAALGLFAAANHNVIEHAAIAAWDRVSHLFHHHVGAHHSALDVTAHATLQHDKLASVLASGDMEVQKAALHALAETGAYDEVAPIIERIAMDPYRAELARAAVFALGDLDGHAAMASLRTVLLHAPLVQVRTASVHALADFDDDDVVSALVECIKTDPSVNIRKAAVHALGSIHTPSANRALVDVLDAYAPL